MAKKLKPEGQEPVLRPETFKSLITQAEAIRGDASEANGAFAKFVQDAERTHGAHRKVFQVMLQLKKQGANEPSKLADYLRAFDTYRTWLKLDDLAGNDLFEESAPDPAPEQEIEEADDHLPASALAGLKMVGAA